MKSNIDHHLVLSFIVKTVIVSAITFTPLGIGSLGIANADCDETPQVSHPCWGEVDDCSGYFKVAAGTAWAGKNSRGSVFTGTDNWWDSGTDDCDEDSDIGTIPDGTALALYIDNAFAIFESNNEGCALIRLDVWEYAAADCEGISYLRHEYDEIEYSYDGSYFEGLLKAHCDDLADCDGSPGDSCDDWHQPDVGFTDNTNNDDRSYLSKISAWVCDEDCSSNCSDVYDQYGCFNVHWE